MLCDKHMCVKRCSLDSQGYYLKVISQCVGVKTKVRGINGRVRMNSAMMPQDRNRKEDNKD